MSCSNVTGTDTAYCCDGGRPFCCDDGVARFEVLPSKPQTHARWDVKASQFVLVQQQTTSSSASTTSSQTSSLPSLPNTFVLPASISTDLPGAQTSPPLTTDNSGRSSGLSSGAQAGIGVGAGVLGLALGAVAYLLFKLRSNKARLAELEKQQGGQFDQATGLTSGSGKPDFAGHQYAGMMEVDATRSRQEIDGGGLRFELYSEPRSEMG